MTLQAIKDHWGLVAALATLAVAWGVAVTRLANAEDHAQRNEQKIVELQQKINTIEQTAVRIETNQMRNREELRDIDEKLEAVLEALREPRQ